MSGDKRAFLIRSMLIAMLLTMLACLGMTGALAQDSPETACVSLDVDGYLLEFEDLLPPSIRYAPAEDTPWADVLFQVDLEAAIAEGEATAAAVRAAQAAAGGLTEPKVESGVRIISKEAKEKEAEKEPEAEEQTEAPENQPEDEKTEPEEKPLTSIFTMELGADEGDWVVVLMDETGDVLPVAFHMAQAPEGLDDKQATAFMLAQEDVQVLLATIRLISLPGEGALNQEGAGVLQADDYELTFSAEVEEVVAARRTDDGRFEFYTDIAGEETVVYTLTVGAEEGHIVLMLTDAQGGKVPAAIEMAACPQELENEARMSFLLAQETVTKVMETLALQ